MRRPLVIASCSLLAARRLRRRDRVPEDDQTARRGAVLFNERCSGCHSLGRRTPTDRSPAASQGGERTNGPNFNVRKENRDDVLFAIRNGGFSGAIMPANIVVGEDAELVADFLSEYSGQDSGTNDPTASGQTGE